MSAAGLHGRIRRAYAEDGAIVGQYHLWPSYRLGVHTHDGASVAVGLSGRYLASIDGREHALDPGQALVYPAGAAHRERVGAAGSDCLLISFGDLPLCDAKATAFAREGVVRSEALHGIGARFASELAIADEATPASLSSLVAELLAEIGGPARCGGWLDDVGWLLGLREELDARLLSPPTLTELARLVGRSREHVARSFRARFGETIGEYLRRRRLDHAASELRSTPNTVAAIAHDAGFADQSHFTRWFRRRFRLTPSRYRRARQTG